MPFTFWISAAVLLLFGPFFVYSWYKRVTAGDAMQKWARETGHIVRDLAPEWFTLRGKPFDEGERPAIRHAVESPEGFRTYQFETTVNHGKSSSRYAYTITAQEVESRAPSELLMMRENQLIKAADRIGGRDIDFESDEFSRKFWVEWMTVRLRTPCFTRP